MSKQIPPERYLKKDTDPGPFLTLPGDPEPLPWDLRKPWDWPDVEHLDGVPWYEAPKPSRWHRCWVQTNAWMGLTQVQRCACGAIRSNGRGPRSWFDRNSR